MENIIIRELEYGDAGKLSALDAEIFTDPWSEQDFERLLEHAYCHYLVAERDGELLGLAGMTDACHEGNIDRVMVAAGERGRGLGQRLLEALIKRGDAAGMTAYTLEVRAGNTPAIRLYEKLGFVSEGRRPGFYEHPKEDALIMWRRG